jgi:hypothetical protein
MQTILEYSQKLSTVGIVSRCRFIDVRIFGFVQATPLGPVEFERRVNLDAGYENSAF